MSDDAMSLNLDHVSVRVVEKTVIDSTSLPEAKANALLADMIRRARAEASKAGFNVIGDTGDPA